MSQSGQAALEVSELLLDQIDRSLQELHVLELVLRLVSVELHLEGGAELAAVGIEEAESSNVVAGLGWELDWEDNFSKSFALDRLSDHDVVTGDASSFDELDSAVALPGPLSAVLDNKVDEDELLNGARVELLAHDGSGATGHVASAAFGGLLRLGFAFGTSHGLHVVVDALSDELLPHTVATSAATLATPAASAAASTSRFMTFLVSMTTVMAMVTEVAVVAVVTVVTVMTAVRVSVALPTVVGFAFHRMVGACHETKDIRHILSRLHNLQEGMIVLLLFFAGLAEIEVRADRALVANTSDWVGTAAVALDAKVLDLGTRLGVIGLLSEVLVYDRGDTLDLVHDDALNGLLVRVTTLMVVTVVALVAMLLGLRLAVAVLSTDSIGILCSTLALVFFFVRRAGRRRGAGAGVLAVLPLALLFSLSTTLLLLGQVAGFAGLFELSLLGSCELHATHFGRDFLDILGLLGGRHQQLELPCHTFLGDTVGSGEILVIADSDVFLFGILVGDGELACLGKGFLASECRLY